MSRKLVLVMSLTIVLIGMLGVALKVEMVEAGGTITIKADGSVEGSTDITSDDNITYTFTDNIYDEIVVEKDDIVIDGAGYTLQGTGIGIEYGIDLSGRNNVTVKNAEIRGFYFGIHLDGSDGNTLSDNSITENAAGIALSYSWNNAISQNNITANDNLGIWLRFSSNYNSIYGNEITANNDWGIELCDSSNNNNIYGNNIVNNDDGIAIDNSLDNTISGNNITENDYGVGIDTYSSDNIISGNNITNNNVGIYLVVSSNNRFYHNYFIDNTQQIYNYENTSTNVWDDGAGKGNYWSDYEERYPNATEIDGIWDTPYVIDENNQDNYPIVPEFPTWTSMLLILIVLTVATAIYKRRLLKNTNPLTIIFSHFSDVREQTQTKDFEKNQTRNNMVNEGT